MAKCVECGYLARRDKEGHGAFEVSEREREIGHGRSKAEAFYCYCNSAKFHHDLKSADTDCDQVRTWEPGKAPQEHKEMAFREEMMVFRASLEQRENDRDNREIQRRREDLEFTAKQRAEILGEKVVNARWRWITLSVAASAALGAIWNAYTNYSHSPISSQMTDPPQAVAPPAP